MPPGRLNASAATHLRGSDTDTSLFSVTMIRAHEDSEALTLDVEGPATMFESAALHDVVGEHVARGIATLRVDLRDCSAMDSTFSGTLLSLKRQLEAAGGSLTLVSPSAAALEVLREMGLEDFYAVEQTERAHEIGRELLPSHPGIESFRRLVLDAHDELGRVPGPAARAFRNVAEELRREESSPDSLG